MPVRPYVLAFKTIAAYQQNALISTDRWVPCVRQRLYHADLDALVAPLLRPNRPYQLWLGWRECLYALCWVEFAQVVE